MKALIKFSIFLLFSNSIHAQEIKHISGFDSITSPNKFLYEINRINDNTAILFFANQKVIWRTDGTKEGTYLLHDFENETNSWISFTPVLIGIVNGKAILEIATKSSGRELWVTDGTIVGTHLLLDYLPGISGIDNADSETSKFAVDSNNCYLTIKENNYWKILKTDGTIEGTEVFADSIIENGFSNIDAPNLFLVGENFYFMFFDKLIQVNKNTKIASILPCESYSYMADIEMLNDSLLLLAIDNNSYGFVGTFNLKTNEIIILDNSIYDFKYDEDRYEPKIFTKFNNKILFSLAKGFTNHIIASTDGTKNGTKTIIDLTYYTRNYFEFEDKLWFTNRDQYYSIFSLDKSNKVNNELTSTWLYDGDPRCFTLLENNKFFVTGPFPQTGNDVEPQIFDPKNKSITTIQNLNPTSYSNPKLLTKLKENYYLFYAYDDVYKGSLYSLKLNPSSTFETINNQIMVRPTVAKNDWIVTCNNIHTKIAYKLTDILGNILKSGFIDSKEFKIDSGFLMSGLYFLSIGNDSNTQCFKLIKR